MKMMKLIYPLAFALAITLASTGCRHKPVGITPIPGSQTGGPNDPNGYGTKPDTGLPTGNPIIPDNPPIIQPGGGQTAMIDSNGYIEDTNALAADTIHFAFDSAAIRKSEQSNLQAVAAALSADSSVKLLIEGNCDERGTDGYNLALGERRALAAREALAKMGIDPMRVETRSFGKNKPVDTGHTEAAWKANRRDDFVLLHPKAGV